MNTIECFLRYFGGYYQSISIDLKIVAGKAVARRLVEEAYLGPSEPK